jgi:Na+-driven multidrug efflux pump
VLGLGLFAAGENAVYWLALIVVTSFVSRLGSSTLAAFAYAQQAQSWTMLVSLSVGLALEIVVARYVGAGMFEQARGVVLEGVRTSLFLVMPARLLLACLAPYIFPIFSADQSIIDSASLVVRFGALVEPGRVSNIVHNYSLRATGDVYFPMLVAVSSMFGVWVPLTWLFTCKLQWGLVGVCAAMIADESLRGGIMLVRWRQRRWLKYAERSRALVSAA